MRVVVEWFTTHLELKITALVLAVALWIYTSGQARVEARVAVIVDPVAAKLAPSMALADIVPREFTVVVSIPDDRAAAAPSVIEPRLDLRTRTEEGAQILRLTPALLGLDPSVRILRSEPPDLALTATLERREEAAVAVVPPPVRGLPAGVEARLVLDAATVRVRGPSRQVQTLRAAGLAALPVELRAVGADLADERSERVVLVLAPPQGIEVLEPVLASVQLRPLPGQRQRLELPLQLALDPALLGRWRVVPRSGRLWVTVSGPENLLKALRTDEVAAYAVVRSSDGFPATGGTMVVPVRVVGPAWMTTEPATAELEVAPVVDPQP
ncbi:MAG: hypothetical protein RLZZ127_121 [Planctomycetota bacterium]|jgi:hypothetical protein